MVGEKGTLAGLMCLTDVGMEGGRECDCGCVPPRNTDSQTASTGTSTAAEEVA